MPFNLTTKFRNKKITRLNQKEVIQPKRKRSKELILPLYFGWEIVIRKVNDLKKHIVGPFKEYWQYLSVVGALILIISVGLIIKNYHLGQAKTYYWTQSDWSGGASTTALALHDYNQTNWTYYYSADPYVISSGTSITIQQMIASTTHTQDTDFTGSSTHILIQNGSLQINL